VVPFFQVAKEAGYEGGNRMELKVESRHDAKIAPRRPSTPSTEISPSAVTISYEIALSTPFS
jgi:hypothetical protein